MSYNDLRQHLQILEEQDLLYRIKREMNKDTEIHPLVRWQFRGLTEEQRKAFLFENVTDARGRTYTIPVTVGAYAASRRVYAMGLGCQPEEVYGKWEYALSHPLDPEVVSRAPCQGEVQIGDAVSRVGLDKFPIPISTPGFDCAPYTTASCLVTKDPETGIQNLGNYRGQVKAPDRMGLYLMQVQDGRTHWFKNKDRGQALEAALVVGPPPVVAATSVAKIPYGVDELSISGSLAAEPIRVVRCKTVDLLVPAEAEVIIEGIISTEYLEPEAPFGESHGFMNPRQLSPYIDITAITNRKDCIWASWISQVTPSESSVIKSDAWNTIYTLYLKKERRIPSVTKVVLHEELTNFRKLMIIQMKNPVKEEVWRALYAALTREPLTGKIIIAVDDDIDPNNLTQVFWAMGYRMNPKADVAIVPYRGFGHAPPFRASETEERVMLTADDSAMLMDATLKEPFPPVSLPKKEYMERAREIWEEIGLPKLTPREPWYGYSLGQWTDEWEEEARLAVQGEYYKTGEKLAKRRVKA